VCRAVLGERAIEFSVDDDLPKLFKTASHSLPFLPVTATDEIDVRKGLVQTLSGLSTAIQGICELRNRCGFASHGSGGPRPAMETTQALLAAEAADTIVGFVHRVHREDRTPPVSASVLYDDYPEFNESVDETHGIVRVFDAEFRPSAVLYQMEPETYRVYLAEFDGEADELEVDDPTSGRER
jgi:abortive infection Abi-like protein